MKARLAQIYYAVSSSFWFIPSLLAGAALIAAVLSLQLDFAFGAYRLTHWLPGPPITQEGARLVVSAIAGSMITVASLVFSMTLVALSFVSQQLGPRIILRLMEDRPTQVVLGVFIATFLYSLVVLGVIGTRHSEDFIPVFSVYTCGVLAVLSLALIIFFIHHISMGIQADNIVARLGRQLTQAIKDETARQETICAYLEREVFDTLSDGIGKRGVMVAARSSGYVQSIDEITMRDLAVAHDLEVRLDCRPGHFVLEGGALAHFVAKPGVAGATGDSPLDDLASLVVMGERRTRQQHIDFEINALVEVALRALSPSMNDPLTAAVCVNRIFAGLRALLGQGNRMRVHVDGAGRPLVLPLPQGFEHFLHTAVAPLRRAGKNDLVFMFELIASLRGLALLAKDEAELVSIRLQIEAIADGPGDVALARMDRDEMKSRIEAALTATRRPNTEDTGD